MFPQISIVIPVYNIEAYLPRCLDSIKNQSFQEWECLCVDDGSTDKSGIILDDYARLDKRFRVFHKENGGVSSARNFALPHVKGEWVWFVDGDDEVAPDAFKQLMSRTSKLGGHDVLIFSFRQGSEGWNKDEVLQSATSGKIIDMKGPRFKDEYFQEMGLSTIWHMLWGTEVVRTTSFQPFALTEDTLFAYTAILRARKVAITDYPGYYYYSRLGSAVASVTASKVIDRIQALSQLMNLLLDSGNKSHARYLMDREWALQGLFWLFRIPTWREKKQIADLLIKKYEQFDKGLRTPRNTTIKILYDVFGLWGVYAGVYIPVRLILFIRGKMR